MDDIENRTAITCDDCGKILAKKDYNGNVYVWCKRCNKEQTLKYVFAGKRINKKMEQKYGCRYCFDAKAFSNRYVYCPHDKCPYEGAFDGVLTYDEYINKHKSKTPIIPDLDS